MSQIPTSSTANKNSNSNKSNGWLALVLGRAGLDLYPQIDGGKVKDAESFTADMGGSAGNIAVALGIASSDENSVSNQSHQVNKVGLISALSQDPVGDFVRQRLHAHHVDTGLVQTTQSDARTSLAIAEVRPEDCEVVIYRNNAADLQLHLTEALIAAVKASQHLVITGTALIAEPSRSTSIKLMQTAQQANTMVWFDLDYRPWNWPDIATTREIYTEAANLANVIIGNEEECAVLNDTLDVLIRQCRSQKQVLLMKRGDDGSCLFLPKKQLNSGVYPTQPLKPYGAGDAFLGNLIHHYSQNQDWQAAIAHGSAAASIVVATRGCASAMPTHKNITALQKYVAMSPPAYWS